MPTAMDGAYARYGHIVNPGLWSRFLDLCIGRALADRLHVARLERAHTQSVEALLERGEPVYPLPGERREDSLFTQTTRGINEEAAGDSTGQRDGGQGKQEEQPYIEPFFWDQLGGELPPVDRILFEDMLPETAPREVDYSTWNTYEWSRRRRPDPSIYTQKAVTCWGTYNGYGFHNDRNPKVSNLSRMFANPESYMTERFNQGFAQPGAAPALLLEEDSGDACPAGQAGDSGCVIVSDSEDNNMPEGCPRG